MSEERLGDYVLLNRIGQGGMGEVHQARAPGGEIVAVKVLSGRYADDDEALIRFQREEQVHASLDHPAIVAARGGLELVEGRAFFAMEYVAGRDLGRLISDEGPLAPKRSVDLALPILDALDYAHGLGVVHRDLKPSNILLDASEHPRLADFGLARMVGFSSLTQVGTVLGTPEFMSPEQARGEEAQAPADVYAMGAVLWAMLGGRPPFQAPQPLAVLRMHVDDPVPPLATPAPLPPGLEGIARRALAKDPSERWPSAGDMATALRALDWDAIPLTGPSDETLLLQPAAAGALAGGVPDETAPLGPASPARPPLPVTEAWAPPPAEGARASVPGPRGASLGAPLAVLALLAVAAGVGAIQSRSGDDGPSVSPSPSSAPSASPPASLAPHTPSLSPTALPLRRVELILEADGRRVVGGLLELDLAGKRLRVRLEGGEERSFPLDAISSYRYLAAAPSSSTWTRTIPIDSVIGSGPRAGSWVTRSPRRTCSLSRRPRPRAS